MEIAAKKEEETESSELKLNGNEPYLEGLPSSCVYILYRGGMHQRWRSRYPEQTLRGMLAQGRHDYG